ncbi:hypothetical protein ACHAWF_005479 [Thalassiosira exigua]
MRAVVRNGLLGLTIAFSDEHPAPDAANASLHPSDVLIKVKSAAINPVDYKLPRAVAGKVVGIDVSGVIEKVGADVTEFRVGDDVFGRAIDSKGAFTGSLAEYATVGAGELAKKPAWLSFDRAAALPTAYLTGIQSLRAGNVAEGSSVLIIGASGGCGVAGVQLAKMMGATRVVGICSGKNIKFVGGISGMDKTDELELVDYTDPKAMSDFMETNAGRFDTIYDTVTGSGKGEDYVASMAKLLKEGTGEYVQINGGLSTWTRHAIGKTKPQRKVVVTSKCKSDLEEILLLVKSGVKPHLDIKPFTENGVTGAFDQLKGRHTKGKIVFNLD